MANIREIKVERLETFPCEGAKGMAANRPRILLQVLNNGDAAARCGYRRGINFINLPDAKVTFYCTAEYSQTTNRESFDKAVREVMARTSSITDPEQQKKQTEEIVANYYPECAFQGMWIDS